ncbi:MAG: EAL domain-containing protein [Drouetiella hepatica Uher 2000/2452]|jgi:diguanylate cyclase (GGDEF)-like protein/PAS domain S-box-containing protein|uniref:EAL domain-containing protein n=1 Tax=Drouetiella hepatica Uher 2000/2452 TaxID=904376 RepID=A0A951QB34_9CYAN|nr:EAL domain-containing protein [Drouetiella hepatica Uher 2000/2452]
MITSFTPQGLRPSFKRSDLSVRRLNEKFWWQFLPAGLATLVVIVLLQFGVCQVIETTLCHALLRFKDPIPDRFQEWLWLALLSVGIGLGGWLPRWRFRYQLMTWLSLCLGWGALSWLLGASGSQIPMAAPMLLFGLCGSAVTLTESVRTYVLLRQSEKRYALALCGTTEGLWDWNLRTDRIDFSPRWKEMLGYEAHELGDRPTEWLSRVHPSDIDALKLALADHCQGQTPHLECEYRLLHRNGSYRWMHSRGLVVRNRWDRVERVVGFQTDTTERREAEMALQRTTFYDALTELPNRVGFMHRLQQTIDDTQTHSTISFAVLWLDIDQFKLVNNSLGNTLGDRLLAAVAQRLKSFLTPENTVARLGGDEFAVLLPQIQYAHDVTHMAERLQQLLSLPFNLDGREVFITVSIGIVLSSAHYTQTEPLLRDADTAMHRAKALGKAQYQVFDRTMRTRMLLKLQLENDLRQAIAQGERYANMMGIAAAPPRHPDHWVPEACADRLAASPDLSSLHQSSLHQQLQIYYQPILCLTTGLVVGFEALARWQHPEQGFLPPAQFIPVAEESGLIIPLSWWVLRAACRQMKQWLTVFPEQRFLTLSVNLSSRQFSMPGLTEQIQQILRETELNPANLKLELTESMVMDNAAHVVDVLYQIRALGIHLAIDDFGTGYSSLSYLPRFPINTLKIDRSFVSQMDTCLDSLEIVRTILVLAHNLGIDVTAEGVETSEQQDQLLEMQCEFGQGYFFSEPMDVSAITQLLERQQPY